MQAVRTIKGTTVCRFARTWTVDEPLTFRIDFIAVIAVVVSAVVVSAVVVSAAAAAAVRVLTHILKDVGHGERTGRGSSGFRRARDANGCAYERTQRGGPRPTVSAAAAAV